MRRQDKSWESCRGLGQSRILSSSQFRCGPPSPLSFSFTHSFFLILLNPFISLLLALPVNTWYVFHNYISPHKCSIRQFCLSIHMGVTVVLFPLIFQLIKCYMNLLKPFNNFISSLRALDLSGFVVNYCFWEDVTGCLMYCLPCLCSQTECPYIPHILTFLSRHMPSSFNSAVLHLPVSHHCMSPFYWYIFLIDYWDLLLSPAK